MDFKKIEAKWQKWWEEHPELYRAEDGDKREKKYVLVEFPYPSGSGLHVGHAFTFTGGDVYARFKRMQGYNVLFPMGWDAFGLPTENYAVKMKRKPQEVTRENTEMFKLQMKKLAFSFDWDREVNTTDPDYYKWTQWIFVQLFKKGLAYKQEMPINWCPSCKIGLANEEVVDGKCERCGAEVSRRNISQWVVKITDYADRLIDGLKNTDFIEKVKAAQINWIGKSEGARIKFKVKDSDRELEVFTTRADTLWGVTFMVISPEHELVVEITKSNEEIRKYVEQAKKKGDLERAELQKVKTGIFSGINMINPVNGKEIPLWVADYVLMGYGTGVVMGVPAHDQRDWEFAKKYNLEILPVIEGNDSWNYEKEAMESVNEGKMINSGFVTGMEVKESIKKVNEWVEKEGIGKEENMYHLRDWIFSRQHYWGEPIPMIFCKTCAENGRGWFNQNPLSATADISLEEGDLKAPIFQGGVPEGRGGLNLGWYPVPEEELPIKLPEVDAYEPTDDGQSPLSKIGSFVNCKCPVCGKDAKRETDTMPNWAGSDWYFMRYCDPHNMSKLADIDILKKWMPVDVYVGGDEHNTLHLLYSRFIYQFLWDLGVVPKEIPEPYYHRMSHGVILGPDNNRMSKSKGNVVVPEIVADKYGVDVIRMYLMFMGPFEGTMAWNENTLMGVKRFLERFEKFIILQYHNKNASKDNNNVLINKLIKGMGDDIEGFGFNTAIAKLMKTINELKSANNEELRILVRLLTPLAPYLAEELWSLLKDNLENESKEGYVSVHNQMWPGFDSKYLIDKQISIAVAVNGRVRDQLIVQSDIEQTKDEIIGEAKRKEKIAKWLTGKTIVKEIYIKNKMINLVIS